MRYLRRRPGTQCCLPSVRNGFLICKKQKASDCRFKNRRPEALLSTYYYRIALILSYRKNYNSVFCSTNSVTGSLVSSCNARNPLRMFTK